MLYLTSFTVEGKICNILLYYRDGFAGTKESNLILLLLIFHERAKCERYFYPTFTLALDLFAGKIFLYYL